MVFNVGDHVEAVDGDRSGIIVYYHCCSFGGGWYVQLDDTSKYTGWRNNQLHPLPDHFSEGTYWFIGEHPTLITRWQRVKPPTDVRQMSARILRMLGAPCDV